MSDEKTCGQCKNCKPLVSNKTHGLCDFVGKIPVWMQLAYDEQWKNPVYTISLDSNFPAECDCFEEVITK